MQEILRLISRKIHTLPPHCSFRFPLQVTPPVGFTNCYFIFKQSPKIFCNKKGNILLVCNLNKCPKINLTIKMETSHSQVRYKKKNSVQQSTVIPHSILCAGISFFKPKYFNQSSQNKHLKTPKLRSQSTQVNILAEGIRSWYTNVHGKGARRSYNFHQRKLSPYINLFYFK